MARTKAVKNDKPLVQAPEEVRSGLEATFADMLAYRDDAEKLDALWKKLRDEVIIPAVKLHGDHTKTDLPDDSTIQIGDHKVQLVGAAKKGYDQDAAFKFLGTPSAELTQEELAKLYNDIVVQTPSIDLDRYKVALKEGRVPEQFRQVFEVPKTTYGLNYWKLSDD